MDDEGWVRFYDGHDAFSNPEAIAELQNMNEAFDWGRLSQNLSGKQVFQVQRRPDIGRYIWDVKTPGGETYYSKVFGLPPPRRRPAGQSIDEWYPIERATLHKHSRILTEIIKELEAALISGDIEAKGIAIHLNAAQTCSIEKEIWPYLKIRNHEKGTIVGRVGAYHFEGVMLRRRAPIVILRSSMTLPDFYHAANNPGDIAEIERLPKPLSPIGFLNSAIREAHISPNEWQIDRLNQLSRLCDVRARQALRDQLTYGAVLEGRNSESGGTELISLGMIDDPKQEIRWLGNGIQCWYFEGPKFIDQVTLNIPRAMAAHPRISTETKAAQYIPGGIKSQTAKDTKTDLVEVLDVGKTWDQTEAGVKAWFKEFFDAWNAKNDPSAKPPNREDILEIASPYFPRLKREAVKKFTRECRAQTNWARTGPKRKT